MAETLHKPSVSLCVAITALAFDDAVAATPASFSVLVTLTFDPASAFSQARYLSPSPSVTASLSMMDVVDAASGAARLRGELPDQLIQLFRSRGPSRGTRCGAHFAGGGA